ncbi:hypothetical protein DBR43_03430 [Pedobacter sp. KBW06]|uniref:hypothetical protein n=1 Tax=Pedobacter sp. KBW06 TaxID=2153359 RepID=UPI000F590CFC|nr:hypothetical protein [Pedobacter sp. KBW06]RQO74457.1 hypothetical protein DBR43_03430 [Pedobacter sp. KBW06]
MKKLSFIFILLLTAATFTKAQTPERKMPSPGEMAMKTTEYLVMKLKLTDVQKTKVTAILTHYNEQMFKAFEANKDNKEMIPAVAKKLEAETELKMNAVLSVEQRAVLAKEKQRPGRS